METTWGGKIGGKKNCPLAQVMSIDNFKTLDSTTDEHILAFDERDLASKNNIKVLREFAPEIVGAKPAVARGQKRGSINDDYAIIGI
eukprot:jgi/Psemu1/301058/fgenesh1_kg.25_\